MQTPENLLDASLSRARKIGSSYPKQRTIFYTIKGAEIAKIEVSAEYLEEALFRSIQAMPSFNNLEPFYKDLYECIIDTNELRKHLSSISSVARLIKRIRRDSLVRLKELKYVKGAEREAKTIGAAYVGRIASLVNGLKSKIAYYNETARVLRELPSIRTNEECIMLAGFPNVGKSTLLKKLTESKPEIANYPFTTKGLNVGVFKKRYIPIQVIDTPGLLDRPLHERNAIELKAVTALQHLKGLIVFVVDPTDDLKNQTNLLAEIKKLFTRHKFLVAITKSDVANEEQVANAKKAFDGYEIIIEGNDKNALKALLLEKSFMLS